MNARLESLLHQVAAIVGRFVVTFIACIYLRAAIGVGITVYFDPMSCEELSCLAIFVMAPLIFFLGPLSSEEIDPTFARMQIVAATIVITLIWTIIDFRRRRTPGNDSRS